MQISRIRDIDATENMRSRVILSVFVAFPNCMHNLVCRIYSINAKERWQTQMSCGCFYPKGLSLRLCWFSTIFLLLQFVFPYCCVIKQILFRPLDWGFWAGTTYTCGFKVSIAILVFNGMVNRHFIMTYPTSKLLSGATEIVRILMTKVNNRTEFSQRMFMWLMGAMPASCCF